MSCNKTHIGETGRTFSTRKKEHQTECKKETSRCLPWTTKEKAEQENLKSAISDHRKRKSHVMDQEKAKIIGSENNKNNRWIKEATEIRKWAQRTIKRDEGAFMLSLTWDALLQRPSDSRRCGPPVKFDKPARSATPK